jgi:hypothetical protein
MWKINDHMMELVHRHDPQKGFLYQDLAVDMHKEHAANSDCQIKYQNQFSLDAK